MKYISLLPADLYTVINKTLLTEYDKKNLISLYEPIIGALPVSLYLSLWSDLDKSETSSITHTHHHLMTILKTKLDDIKEARKALEATGLLRTYYKDGEELNSYIYELYAPLSASEFFNHPILNIVLYNNIGKDEYEELIKNYKKKTFNYTGFEEISEKINTTFSSVPASMLAGSSIKEKETNKPEVTNLIDFDLLSSSIPNNILNEKTLNKKNKELINSLAFIYNLDTLKMSEIIRICLDEQGMLNRDILQKEVRKYYEYNNTGALPTLIYRTQPEHLKTPDGDTSSRGKMIYIFENTTPYDFLRSKYKTGEPSLRDLKLIESLLVDQKMTPGVVNVLIAYVLKINNQKLSKNYIDTIAGQWKRLNIETVEEAMRISEKEHKKLKKQFENKNNAKAPSVVTKNKKIEELPDWFNKDLKNEEMTEDDVKELDDILNSIDQSIANISKK